MGRLISNFQANVFTYVWGKKEKQTKKHTVGGVSISNKKLLKGKIDSIRIQINGLSLPRLVTGMSIKWWTKLVLGAQINKIDNSSPTRQYS